MSESTKIAPNGQWKLVKAYGDTDDKTNPGAIPMTADGVPVATARTAAAQPWRAGDTWQHSMGRVTDPQHARFLPPVAGGPQVDPLVNPAQHADFKRVPGLVKPPMVKPGQMSWKPSGSQVEGPLATGTATHVPSGNTATHISAPSIPVHESHHIPRLPRTAKSETPEKMSVNKGGQWSLDKAALEHCSRCKEKPCTCIKTEGILVER